jgi:hypothetical protein
MWSLYLRHDAPCPRRLYDAKSLAARLLQEVRQQCVSKARMTMDIIDCRPGSIGECSLPLVNSSRCTSTGRMSASICTDTLQLISLQVISSLMFIEPSDDSAAAVPISAASHTALVCPVICSCPAGAVPVLVYWHDAILGQCETAYLHDAKPSLYWMCSIAVQPSYICSGSVLLIMCFLCVKDGMVQINC